MTDPTGVRHSATETHGNQGPAHMMWFVGQLFMIPVAAFVYGVELLVKTMQEMQKATSQGIGMVVGNAPGAAETAVEASESEVSVPQTIDGNGQESGSNNLGENETEEKTLSDNGGITGSDRDLHDDMLKLVRYKILFVKREYEHAFGEKEDLVSENMDGSAFTAWKIAEFIQDLQKKATLVPEKWRHKSYPGPGHETEPVKKDLPSHLTSLPDHDKKYLRVYYEVLERYVREKFKYEEDQIKVLEQIRDKIPFPKEQLSDEQRGRK